MLSGNSFMKFGPNFDLLIIDSHAFAVGKSILKISFVANGAIAIE
jgi:hypothetical protein